VLNEKYNSLQGAINALETQIIDISGSYVTLGTSQTITGNKTFDGSLNAVTVDILDDSTSVATTEWVKDYIPIITGGFVTATANNTFTGINSFVNPVTPTTTTFDDISCNTLTYNTLNPPIPTPSLASVLTAGNTATNSIILNNGALNVITTDPSANTIVITDGTTTNTINQSGYTTRNSVQNVAHYLNFSDSSSTGTGAIQKTAGLSCNPSTNTITATTFIGDLSGNATTATAATTATNIAGGAASQIPYQSGANTTTFITNGTVGQVLTSNGASTPIWATPSSPTFASVTYTCNVLTNGNVKGTGTGSYIQIGNFVQVLATVSFTLTGDANGIIALSLPAVVTTGTSNTTFYGNFGFIRSGVAWYFGNAAIINAGTISGIAYGSQNYMGVSVPMLTMQVGDTVSTSCCFFV
jgi:hypothetical protein